MSWLRFRKNPALIKQIAVAGNEFGSPLYLYDEYTIRRQCRKLVRMPSAYGLTVRYAMKANPNRSLLRVIYNQGLSLDVSSMNEVKRAKMAGIPLSAMMLTSQDVPNAEELLKYMIQGLRYTICSQKQLENIGPLAANHRFPLAIRIHHGIGSGESESRNTSSPYASFGVVLDELPKIKKQALQMGIEFTCIHGHIGSGSNPEIWKEHVDRLLYVLERFFPEAETVNLGGGFKVARMHDEIEANVQMLGEYMENRFIQFANRSGRRLKAEIEPGTFVMANAGMLITRILDIKRNPQSGWTFLITDGGIESNVRPLMYGARHPFALLSKQGVLQWVDDDPPIASYPMEPCVVVGRCCETGDCQTLDNQGRIIPRNMPVPHIGDWLLVGGIGAYSSTISPFQYNSYLQSPEVLLTEQGDLFQIRRRQSLEQLIANEWPAIEYPIPSV